MIRKWRNRKEILSPKTEVKKHFIHNQILTLNSQSDTNTKIAHRKPSEQLWPLSDPKCSIAGHQRHYLLPLRHVSLTLSSPCRV